MNKDRLVQLASLMIAVVLLACSTVLIPSINTQRRQLQLSADPVVGDNIPPHIAIATTTAGAFRGLLVDALWYRVEMQKRDGQYREANSLSEAIVSLQPHFPQVWSFIAWNQSYNISVGTYTPEERWDWVSKGERMLRTRGIPYNPNAVVLYKELAWIWFHKIGGNTDDFHNYYKHRVAEHWEQILGPPPPGADPEIVVAWFEPIRDAADRYFVFARPSHEMMTLIDRLEAMTASAEQTEAIDKLRTMDVLRLRDTLLDARELSRVVGPRRTEDQAAAELVDELIALAEEAAARSEQDPLNALYAKNPEAKPLIDAMRELDFGLGKDSVLGTVQRIGRLSSFLWLIPPDQVPAWAEQSLPPEDQALLGLMLDPQREEQWRAVLPFLRAKAVVHGMRMDPGKMHEMMVEYGPLDWRHPTSHSLYWSRLGVERSGILNDTTKVDILNTYRGVVHALQALTDTGRVNYDPLANRPPTYQPDPRFIDAYDQAVVDGKQWVVDSEGRVDWGTGVISSYKAGHENFLQVAVTLEYLYGQEARAQERYQYLKELYQDEPHNVRKKTYDKAMTEFITATFLEDGDMNKINRGFIDGLLYQAFIQGLAERRADVFTRFINLAAASHQRYNSMRGNSGSVAYAGRERIALPPFAQEMVPDAIARYLMEPAIPIDMRSSAYRFAPPGLRQAVYPKFQRAVVEELRARFAVEGDIPPEQAQAVFDRWFPRPPGVSVPDEGPGTETSPVGPNTIQRQ